MNDDDLHHARDLMRYALDDLRLASAAGELDEVRPRHACWLAQQAVEKALKAALTASGKRYRHTHDLGALLESLPEDWAVARQRPDLGGLTQWATMARYPVRRGDRRGRDASEADAEVACSSATSIVASIQADLEGRLGVGAQRGNAPKP